jgi:hypothetical protein
VKDRTYFYGNHFLPLYLEQYPHTLFVCVVTPGESRAFQTSQAGGKGVHAFKMSRVCVGWNGLHSASCFVRFLFAAASVAKIQSSDIVSFALVPHHVQRLRRLQKYDSGASWHDQADNELRRSRYPRFLLQDFQQNQQQQAPNSTARLRHLALHAEQVAALFQGYGTHYADLWCGTPPQRQTVIVDTGSSITAFPCSECISCGVPDYHIDQLFSETNSASFKKLPCGQCLAGHCDRSHCQIGQSFEEGSSWYANEVVDTCYVGGLHTNGLATGDHGTSDVDPFHAPEFAIDLRFGCQTTITGLFISQMAGTYSLHILGLLCLFTCIFLTC